MENNNNNSKDEMFPDGMFFKEPHVNAPRFVIGKIAIDKKKLLVWLGKQPDDWVNLDILKKKDKDGAYIKVNDYKSSDKDNTGEISEPETSNANE